MHGATGSCADRVNALGDETSGACAETFLSQMVVFLQFAREWELDLDTSSGLETCFLTRGQARIGTDGHKPEIDVLAAPGLTAMNRDEIFAGFEGMAGGLAQGHLIVRCGPTTLLKDESSIDVNLGVVIVVKPEFKVGQFVCRNIHVATKPDVCGVPERTHDGTRRVLSAESSSTFFPGRRVEPDIVVCEDRNGIRGCCRNNGRRCCAGGQDQNG